MARPDETLSSKFAHRLSLGLFALMFGLCVLPRVHAHPVVLGSVVGAGGLLAAWHLYLHKSGRALSVLKNVKKPHYIQMFCHSMIYAYWGWEWRHVYDYVPLLLAQICFAYLFDMALTWHRHGKFFAGFGHIPIVLSTNLFIWFKDEAYFWQLPMLALAFLSKDLLQWNRDGVRRHIFNPSGFALAVASLILIPTQSAHLTWAEEIATTLARPDHIFVWIFGLGLLVQMAFPVVLMSLSAFVACLLFGAMHFNETGLYVFVDTAIPIAVFLGLTFLFTDPATSPSSTAGKLIFGFLYGAAVVLEFNWLQTLGRPAIGAHAVVNLTYFDKLLQVPVLNLLVPLIDRLGRFIGTERFGFDINVPRVRYASVGVYALVFAATLPSLTAHPGRDANFWADRCERGTKQACLSLSAMLGDACQNETFAACDTLGTMYEDGAGVPVNESYAAILHERACLGAVAKACTNLGVMMLEGRGGPKDATKAAGLFLRACDGGDGDGCQNARTVYRGGGGGGVEVDLGRARELEVKARGLYAQACDSGEREACERKQAFESLASPR